MVNQSSQLTPEQKQKKDEVFGRIRQRNEALIDSTGDYLDVLTLQQDFYY